MLQESEMSSTLSVRAGLSRNPVLDMVKEGSRQDPKVLDRHYTHYSVLRTIEDNFDLEPLAEGDRNAEPITDIWK